MTLHVVLPVHNRVAVTLQFIDSLRNQDFSDFRLVLVDDGSTDGTANSVRERMGTAPVTVLRGDGGLWWAGALQVAYEHLRSIALKADDAVMLINDDVQFARGFFTSGMALLVAQPDACIQAVSVDPKTGHTVRGVMADTRRLLFRATAPGELPNCLATRGLLMAARTFVNSGGFRPRWLPHYLSDYEFTMRLHRHGVPLLCHDAFRAEFDATTTGHNAYARGVSVGEFWTRTFSNRAKYNPKHWSAFVLMVCPYSAMPRHLIGIWWRFARELTRAIVLRQALPR